MEVKSDVAAERKSAVPNAQAFFDDRKGTVGSVQQAIEESESERWLTIRENAMRMLERRRLKLKKGTVTQAQYAKQDVDHMKKNLFLDAGKGGLRAPPALLMRRRALFFYVRRFRGRTIPFIDGRQVARATHCARDERATTSQPTGVADRRDDQAGGSRSHCS
jgi:hypothetical protein